MNKIERTKIERPECLVKKSKDWTKKLIEKRKIKKNYWNWHRYNNKNVEHILIENLSVLTNFCCSYCGIYPLMQNVGSRSIDHFKPKSKFPELAFEWTNLFVVCEDCQKIKKDSYPQIEPIKPDNLEYDFDYWFEINWKNNFIEPNKIRNDTEKNIAQTTIEWLGLNKGFRPKIRFEELKKYKKNANLDIEIYSYKYFLERS